MTSTRLGPYAWRITPTHDGIILAVSNHEDDVHLAIQLTPESAKKLALEIWDSAELAQSRVERSFLR